MWGTNRTNQFFTYKQYKQIVSPFRSKKSSFHVVAWGLMGNLSILKIRFLMNYFHLLGAKQYLKYSTGTATIVSEFKNSFSITEKYYTELCLANSHLAETAVRDFPANLQEKTFPNVAIFPGRGYSNF